MLNSVTLPFHPQVKVELSTTSYSQLEQEVLMGKLDGGDFRGVGESSDYSDRAVTLAVLYLDDRALPPGGKR